MLRRYACAGKKSCYGLFDDFGDKVQAVLGLGGDTLEVGMAVCFGDDVVTQPGGEFLRMAHRFDARGVGSLHFFDEGEYVIKFFSGCIDLFCGEVEVCKAGNFFDLFGCE